MTAAKPRRRLRGDAAWPLTADELASMGMEYEGVPLVDLSGATDTAYGSYGHVAPHLMAEEDGLLIGQPEHPGTVTPDHVVHTWAVMEPSYAGAPDDEWSTNWGPEITWATPGAFPLTIVSIPA